MRIFLTGGRGMVGRNFLEHASAAGHEIFSPTSKELDLRDYACTRELLRKINPDVIMHAAGIVGGIQANMREPVKFLVENLDMGRNIVMAASSLGVRKLINLGSSCMYPRNAANPLQEELILNGELEPTNEGYALAKIVTARLCEYVSRENSALQYKTLIPCNIYGAYDNFNPSSSHMVPAIIHKLHQAKQLSIDAVDIWGDGTARREFLFAADLASCMWRAIEHFDTMPSMLNVGLGHDYAVNDYYTIAAKVIGYSGSFSHDLTKPVGMKQKLVSVERATSWGWRATTSIEDGLFATYQHYLKELKS